MENPLYMKLTKGFNNRHINSIYIYIYIYIFYDESFSFATFDGRVAMLLIHWPGWSLVAQPPQRGVLDDPSENKLVKMCIMQAFVNIHEYVRICNS